MKITLQQQGKSAHFIGTSSSGHTNQIHAPLFNAETKQAQSPMEALLLAVAGCTSVDIVMILNKMQEVPKNITIEIHGERREINQAKPFRKINIEYTFLGLVNETKVNKAVKLSVEKYCSVIESLHPDCEISYETHFVS